MSISDEFNKFTVAKREVRKSIQQNHSPMKTEDYFEQYSPAIDEFTTEFKIDYTDTENYVVNSEKQYILPDTITKLRDFAFYNDTSLVDLVITSPKIVTLGENVFKNTKIESKEGTIYVPDELLDQYKQTNWGEFNLKARSTLNTNKDKLYPIETISGHLTVGDISSLSINQIGQKF